jgi:hypothetical protein
MIVDSAVSLDDASKGIESKWFAEKDPLILRIKIRGHNAVFVFGPYTRDIQESFLRAHALTKDNGPIISRLFNAD